MNARSPTLNHKEGRWPRGVGISKSPEFTLRPLLFAGDQPTRQGTQWMSTQFHPSTEAQDGIISVSWKTSFALSNGCRSSRPLGSALSCFLSPFFPFFLTPPNLCQLDKAKEQVEEQKSGDCPNPGQMARKEQRTITHLRPPNKPVPAPTISWEKPALPPPFLTSPAVTRTKLQGHKLTHTASFCLDHRPHLV